MDILALSKSVCRRIQAAALGALFRSSRRGHDKEKTDHDLYTSEERRLNLRVPVGDMQVHVTDGCFFTPALIENISSTGICLRNLPEHIFWRTERLIVYSSSNHAIPVLHIVPVWEQVNTEGKMIGARILNISRSWQLFFTKSLEQANPPE